MTLAPSTWMLATLDECCERYYGWMLNECKQGLFWGWSVGALVSRFVYLSFFQETFNLISYFLLDLDSFADWNGSDDTCKNE